MARFRIVPERSAVVIRATSSVHPINTRTSGLEGFLDLEVDSEGRVDVEAEAKAELSLRVDRLASGNPLQDRELRRRIDARRYPTIDGRLTGIRPSDADGRYLVRGDLTFKGVTQDVEDEIVFTVLDDGALHLEGQSQFDVRDFGMEPPRILLLRVHPEVKVRLDLVAAPED